MNVTASPEMTPVTCHCACHGSRDAIEALRSELRAAKQELSRSREQLATLRQNEAKLRQRYELRELSAVVVLRTTLKLCHLLPLELERELM